MWLAGLLHTILCHLQSMCAQRMPSPFTRAFPYPLFRHECSGKQEEEDFILSHSMRYIITVGLAKKVHGSWNPLKRSEGSKCFAIQSSEACLTDIVLWDAATYS